MFNSRVNRAIVAFITLQGDQGRFQQHRSKTCHHIVQGSRLVLKEDFQNLCFMQMY